MTAPVAPIEHPVDGTTTRAASTRSTLAVAVGDVRAAWTGAPPSVRLVTLGAVAAALGSIAGRDVTMASGSALALLVPAALVDWRQRRLPDAIVVVAAAVFTLASLGGVALGGSTSMSGIAFGVAVFAGPILVLHLVSPSAMGFGDVKTAIVLGMALGAVAWGLAVWALTAAATATALVGLWTRRRSVPFGPGLVAGATAAVATTAVAGLDRIGF